MPFRHIDVEERLSKVIIAPDRSISDALTELEVAGTGILLVCGEKRRLLGVLTDGDFRRAILDREPFDRPCIDIAEREPVTGGLDITLAEALHFLDQGREFYVNHLPLVDDEGTVRGVVLRTDIVTELDNEVSAVIMAGGFGRRLRPLTENTPKPMLQMGDRPMMEWTVSNLKKFGIKKVCVTTHYKAKKIKDHFGDGSKFGLDMSYVSEDMPLGTAGSLSLMESPTNTQLVMNGDILTKVDFGAMLEFHKKNKADLTIGVRKYETEIPYGVVESDGAHVIRLKEKPKSNHFINAGIYYLEPVVCDYITRSEYLDMTDLISILLEAGRTVISFPIVEYWRDIGHIDEYHQAKIDFKKL